MKLNIYIQFLLFSLMLYSQDCPPGQESWDEGWGAAFETIPYDIYSSGNYKYNDIGNNTYEVIMFYDTYDPTCTVNFDFNDEENETLVYRDIMRQLMSNCQINETFTFIFYKEVNCYIEKTCYIETLSEDQIHCVDDGWTGAYPEFLNRDNTWVTKDSRKYFCGTGCCKTIIEAECRNIGQGTSGPVYPYIISIINEPFFDCNTTIIDCFTGEVKSCTMDCD